MNERELRAYAHRGLTARLAELDDERARILVLLAEWGDPAGRTGRRLKRQDVQAQRSESEAPGPTPASEGADLSVHTQDSEIEIARVLPRRRRASAPVTVAVLPPPALPPMPRLVKARAS